MALLINQGKQKIEDNGIIVADDVQARISGIKLHPTLGGALIVTFTVINGALKNRTFSDTINYDPSNKMSWKYTQLRRCAGVPYKEGEAERVDIEKLLLNKCVGCDLSERLDNKGNKWQNVKYKAITPDPASTTPVSTDESDEWGDLEPVEERDEEDLPF